VAAIVPPPCNERTDGPRCGSTSTRRQHRSCFRLSKWSDNSGSRDLFWSSTETDLEHRMGSEHRSRPRRQRCCVLDSSCLIRRLKYRQVRRSPRAGVCADLPSLEPFASNETRPMGVIERAAFRERRGAWLWAPRDPRIRQDSTARKWDLAFSTEKAREPLARTVFGSSNLPLADLEKRGSP
jgi:hypothetical protein